jgi:2-oxoglutarate ferredoxin oxidoreductase subunit alpha
MILSDGYIANGSEPWSFPKSDELDEIIPPFAKLEDDNYLPYERDANYVRSWAIPGTSGFEHRLGGLEKEHKTGNVSYEPDNHQLMVELRAAKVQRLEEFIPQQEVECGAKSGSVLIVSWGSTYGAARTATMNMERAGISVGHTHLRYLNPFPSNLGTLLSQFDKVLVPELNNGQLVHLIRDRYLIDAQPLNKVKGLPFLASEIEAAVHQILQAQ